MFDMLVNLPVMALHVCDLIFCFFTHKLSQLIHVALVFPMVIKFLNDLCSRERYIVFIVLWLLKSNLRARICENTLTLIMLNYGI